MTSFMDAILGVPFRRCNHLQRQLAKDCRGHTPVRPSVIKILVRRGAFPFKSGAGARSQTDTTVDSLVQFRAPGDRDRRAENALAQT